MLAFFLSRFFYHIRLLSVLIGMPLMSTAYAAAAPDGFETQAKQALLIDLNTSEVLFEKDAEVKMVPSSMTKILTTYLIFDSLTRGKLKLSDTYLVSEKAWRMGGSKMFVPLGEMVALEDLIQGIIVQSGNDACIVAAEGISGSEEAFVRSMNAKAKELGAIQTHFLNTTGWPEDGHLTTCWDLAKIAQRTIQDFPELYHKYYAQPSFTYNKIKQPNRNPLLMRGIGDGLKTGHTADGGYGLVGSGVRDGRRLLLVINGLSNQKMRAEEAARLMNWGFHEFHAYELFKPNQPIETAEVWMGTAPSVQLVSEKPVTVTARRRLWPEVQAKIRYQGPVAPPIQKGQALGEIIVSLPGAEPKHFPLVAAESVEKQGFFIGMWKMFSYFLWGNSVKQG